ncbi:MAG: hypothetical protein CMJ83_00015 [Planctomycetes bacterium]|nr:hypothetical protein [Planctomycetota bacterium]
MTDGDAKRTVPWVKKLKMKYAYGYDNKFPWVFSFNIWTYPYALLVAPNGTVAWAGHPEKLDEDLIRRTLKGALTTPLFRWPQAVADVRTAIREGKLKVALDRVKALAAKTPTLAMWVGEVQKLITARVSGLAAAKKAGDYCTVLDRGDAVQEQLQDLPEEEKVAELMNSVFDDEQAIATWNTQTRLRTLKATMPRTKQEADDAIKKLEALMKANPASAVVAEGKMAVGVLKKMRGYLK